MIKHLSKILPGIICLLALQLSCRADNWVPVALDSAATIYFPEKPEAAGYMGVAPLVVTYQGNAYVALRMALPGDYSNITPDGLDSIYGGMVTGVKSKIETTNLQTSYFLVDSIKGIEITYSGKINSLFAYGRTRGLFVNGTIYTYSVTCATPAGLTSPDVERFLTSLKLHSPDNEPIMQYDAKPASGFDKYYKIGYTIGKAAVFSTLLVIIIIGIGVFVRRRKKSKAEPPQPGV